MQTVLRGSFQAALAFVALTLVATQAQALDVASQISGFQISMLTSRPRTAPPRRMSPPAEPSQARVPPQASRWRVQTGS